jgi:hypothetical protein
MLLWLAAPTWQLAPPAGAPVVRLAPPAMNLQDDFTQKKHPGQDTPDYLCGADKYAAIRPSDLAASRYIRADQQLKDRIQDPAVRKQIKSASVQALGGRAASALVGNGEDVVMTPDWPASVQARAFSTEPTRARAQVQAQKPYKTEVDFSVNVQDVITTPEWPAGAPLSPGGRYADPRRSAPSVAERQQQAELDKEAARSRQQQAEFVKANADAAAAEAAAETAAAEAAAAAAAAAPFLGRWKLDKRRSDALEPLLKALGVPWAARLALARATLVKTIAVEGVEWVEVILLGLRTTMRGWI